MSDTVERSPFGAKWVGGGLLVAALLTSAAALAWPRLTGHTKSRFAVVDLATVVRKNQEASVALLANGAADRAARDSALASAQGFGKRLDAAVVSVSKECGCLLLMREAVIAGDIEDLTPALMSQLSKQGDRP